MRTTTLKRYMELCRQHGWNPSFDGLNAFALQLKTGLREKWASRGIR